MFVEKLNAATGEMEWHVADAADESGAAGAELIAGSSYLDSACFGTTPRPRAFRV
jgi:hypothetical protein